MRTADGGRKPGVDQAGDRGRAAAIVYTAAAAVFGIFLFSSTFSIAISQISLGLAFVLWAALCLLDPGSRPGLLPIAIPLAVFTLISIVSALLSGDPPHAIFNLRNYLLFATVWIAASLAYDPLMRGRFYAVLLVSGTGSAAYGIIVFLLGRGRGSLGRTPGSFSTEMTFGGITMLLLSLFTAMSIAPGLSRRIRSGSVAAAVVTAAALMLTQTRSSWLAMFVSCAVIFALTRRRWLPVFLAAVAAAILIAPAGYRERVSSMFDPSYRTNVQRINMIKGGMSIFLEHPVIGTGPVDLGEIYREHMPEGAVHVHGHMHNIFMQVAVTLGALGLASFVWLLVSMSMTIGRNLRLDLPPPARGLAAGGMGAMAGFVVNGLFDWNFGDAEVLTVMLIVIGLNAGIFRGSAAGKNAPRPGGPPRKR